MWNEERIDFYHIGFQTFWKFHKDCCFVLLNGSVHSVQRGYGSFSSKIWISCLALLQLWKNTASRRRRLGTIAFSTASRAQLELQCDFEDDREASRTFPQRFEYCVLQNMIWCRCTKSSNFSADVSVLWGTVLCSTASAMSSKECYVLRGAVGECRCAMRSCRRVQMCYEEL